MLQVTRSVRRAFTALELLVAISIGLIVAGTMFALFRAVAGTANRVARMSQENQALRTGLIAVCEQNVDRWIDADDPRGDPGDPRPDYLKNVIRNSWNANVWNQSDASRPIDGSGGQGLRGFDTTGATSGQNRQTGSKQGLPFTPFEWLRDLSEFGDPALQFWQPGNGVPGSEDETGWDRDYHWAAADPRTWFHGDAGVLVPTNNTRNPGGETRGFRLAYGFYALISNPWRSFDLVAGYTERGFGTNLVPLRSWRERMLLGLLNSLGYYGMADYLPANTIYATHGGPAPEAPTPAWRFNGNTSGGSGSVWYGFPAGTGLPNEMYWGAQIINTGIFPASVYARTVLWPDNYNSYSYLGSRAKNQGQVRTTGLVAVHRDNNARKNHAGPIYYGPMGNYEGKDWEMVNMATAKRPLLLQRPDGWPEVIIGTSRVLWGAQYMNTCLVRWSDPQSGRYQAVTFNVFGTTLRGARQQRRLPDKDANGLIDYSMPGGWARWREPWALRKARREAVERGDIPNDPWVYVPNDRCLDDYHDPHGTAPADRDPEFQP